ncbi:hypothetical protein BWI15_18790 [Kribbella sp. ALI-6-A]|uniref:hypothetical protein n=1 Tax=Kribbella sp. ALI-6-A TaxID=1933817 RepID=UPI00097C2D60|nr:hypothetical protein [Kribbella sp. ALI-6-A]ONI72125.1 hypothetical protein BWI15_18790 [Kribbella sp. ALI-6-A]
MSFGERPQDQPRNQSQYPQYGRPDQGRPGYGNYPLQPGCPDQPAYGVLRDNSNATVALVLGLLPLITGLLILSPIAWWKANQALAEIDAAPGVYNNRGMAVGGQIAGIIGTVLLILVVVGVAAMLLLFGVFLD